MNLARLIAQLLTLSCLVGATAFSMQASDPLLDQAYRLNSTLSAVDKPEQLYHMIELSRVSTVVHVPPEQGKRLCVTLFSMASAEKDLRLRIVGQKSAARYLSYFEPVLAMSLLREVSVQQPEPNQPLYEDPRYNAADDVFLNYLLKVKPRGLSTITDTARYLGQTGQYPYHAMAMLIEHLPPAFRSETNSIVSDALASYGRETGYRNRDEEFLKLLRSLLQSSDVDRDLMGRAVSTFVQRLLHDPVDVPGNYYGQIYPSRGTRLSFVDRKQAFLFQAFPVIRRFNSDLATELLQQYPQLDEATDNMRYISGGFVMGNVTPEQANIQHSAWIQESLLTAVKERAHCDSGSAAELAQQLTDIRSRIVGFSSTIPALAQQRPGEARKLYNSQVQEFASLRKPADKLPAEVALVGAAYSVGDPQYRTMKEDAFESGVALFNSERSSADRVQNVPSLEQLKDLMAFTAASPSDSLNTRIQQLPDNWLKAYLLLYQAEARATLTTHPALTTKCSD
jgi:hypothetical protein